MCGAGARGGKPIPGGRPTPDPALCPDRAAPAVVDLLTSRSTRVIVRLQTLTQVCSACVATACECTLVFGKQSRCGRIACMADCCGHPRNPDARLSCLAADQLHVALWQQSCSDPPSGGWSGVPSAAMAAARQVAEVGLLVVRRGHRVREAHAAGDDHPLLLVLRLRHTYGIHR